MRGNRCERRDPPDLYDLSTKRSQLAGQDLPAGTYHLWVTAPGLPVIDATIELTK